MADTPDFDMMIQQGLTLPDEKQIYANGFVVSMSPTDAIIVLQKNNKPVISINLSHTIAKTLAQQLAGIIGNFEKETDIKIATLTEVVEAVENANKKRN